MMKMRVFIRIILAVIIAGVSTAALLMNFRIGHLTDELTETRNDLEAVREAFDEIEKDLGESIDRYELLANELSATQQELDTVTTELDEVKEEKDDIKDSYLDSLATLNKTELELADTQYELSSKDSEISSLENDLHETRGKLHLAEETLNGLGITVHSRDYCYDVFLVNNQTATNPTWRELKNFLLNDETEKRRYELDIYDCSEFSRDLHNNAEEAGIRAARVTATIKDSYYGHALNAFMTTDYGLVYVDCTSGADRVARIYTDMLLIAVDYWQVDITKVHDNGYWNEVQRFYYIEADSGGQAVVDDITIYW